jgi:predicted RNA-binding protein with TRAM domain
MMACVLEGTRGGDAVTSADGDITEGGRRPRWRSRGYLVTMGTVLSLAGGLGFTVLGLGAADQAVASFDAASWVWSRAKGEAARINGVTAKVDTRVQLTGARGHQLEVSQTDRFVILRDVATGNIGTLDLATLREFWNTNASNPGFGVRVALHENTAFVIDTVQGKVQQIDPGSLSPLGEALRFPQGITGGAFDGKGRLWIAAPSEGTVTAIAPAALPSGEPVGGNAPSATGGPQIVRTEPVAPQSHDLTLSALQDGVAVLNRTTNELRSLHDGQSAQPAVTLPLAGPGSLAPRTDGGSIPVTVADARRVYVVDGNRVTADFAVPGNGSRLQPAVAWEGYFYVADEATGSVHVFDSAGQPRKDIGFSRAGGQLELEVREGYLFINAPGSSTARVVDDEHRVRTVDKYADDVLGGDPPDTPPAPPPPPPKPRKPAVSKPGAPRNVRAAAGNAEARVTWQAADSNGAAITRYVVVGAGRTFPVGADQRSLTVTGLTNGETYEFRVHAVNKKGDGPARTSNRVKPTAEVPDAPTAVTAEARPDGTVVVSWPKANGQGLAIKRYTVTAVSEGGSAPAGDATDTSLTIPAGALDYGRQYAFTVVSVNELGAGSKASPVSGSVVPYNVPGQPEGVEAATVGDRAGAIRVGWQAAAENGRPITKYVVSAGGKTSEVTGTSATLTGFADGANVAVEVRAVNEAGEGPPGTATATTMAAPKVTITGVSPTFNQAAVSFTVDAGGASSTTCSVAASGAGSASGNCKSLTVRSLKPSTSYTFTVTVTNQAGSVTAQRAATTDALYGTATCINGEEGDTATYCDKDVAGRNGNEIFSVTRQDNDKQVGWVKNGTRLKSFCKKSGDSIDSYIYNHHKESTWWVRVDYQGKNYIPWAWLNLDGGDDINDLPTC